MTASTKQFWITLSFIFGVVFLASGQTSTKSAQSTKAKDATTLLVGKWTGTYEGPATGECELEFSRDGNGKAKGQIAFKPTGGEKVSPIPFSSVTVEGSTVKATFTDPDGDNITMDGKLENNQLKGTWSPEGGDSGTWQTSKAQ